MRRLDCHNRLKEVLSDYSTALRAVETLIELAGQHLDYMQRKDIDLSKLRSLEEQLHDVYFAHLFASFESSLRHYWKTGLKRKSKPMTKELFASIAVKQGVPQDILDVIHEIRDFRNFLVHEEHRIRRQFTIKEASGHMNTFMARLPLEW